MLSIYIILYIYKEHELTFLASTADKSCTDESPSNIFLGLNLLSVATLHVFLHESMMISGISITRK